MADDIVERIRKNLPSIEWEQPLAAERERLAADEIERLRAREQDLRMHAEQDACEIERLRAAGDEMVDAAIRQQWSRLDVAVAAWQEARRG